MTYPTHHRTVRIGSIDIFYREAGPPEAPAILLLHGYPTSSHMFRNLIPPLAERHRVVAPDYPGFGQSAAPSRKEFDYTFDNLARVVDDFTQAIGLARFAVYVQDYGAPVGYRIAAAHPERITGLIVQNGNAYEEGIAGPFWTPVKAYWANPTRENREAMADSVTLEATKWQYLHGVKDPTLVSPDAWIHDMAHLGLPERKDIYLDLFLSYGTNPPLYPAWQAYFRAHQPPTLVVWGKNDEIFPAAGAHPYKRDIRDVDFHLLDAGHFALEDKGPEIADKILAFMQKRTEKR